jgi:hypothetical protein
MYVQVLGKDRYLKKDRRYLNQKQKGPFLPDGTVKGPRWQMQFTWQEAMDFCNRVSRNTGNRVRLPTEAEWERACRAGTSTKYFWGKDSSSVGDYTFTTDELRWWNNNHNGMADFIYVWPPSVDHFKPNPWGLYGLCLCGQWCSDWYDPDYYRKIKKIPQIDPTGPKSPPFPKEGLTHVRRAYLIDPTNRFEASEKTDTVDWWTGLSLRVVVEAPLSQPREFTGVFKLKEIKQGKCLDEASYMVFASAMGNIIGCDGTKIAFGEVNPDKPPTTGGVKLPPDLASPTKPDDTIKVHALVQLVIPNKLTAEKFPDPDPDMYALFKDTKAGSLLKIKIRAIPGQSMYDIISAEHYKLAPGEDKPGVYVFQRTATMTLQKADHPAVVLSKYLEETTLAVVNPLLAAALDKFKTGDSVRVTFAGKVLNSIEAYKP